VIRRSQTRASTLPCYLSNFDFRVLPSVPRLRRNDLCAEDLVKRLRPLVTLAVVLLSVLATSLPRGVAAEDTPRPNSSDQAAIEEAGAWIGRPEQIETEYRYVMTCRVRLLLFWAGRDDVGEGYVRLGKASGEERQQMIQILFGSDPAKAPLAINRWGAGIEVLRRDDSGQPVSSAFFGFMKSSKGQSVGAMQRELSKEQNNGDHIFEGILSRVDDSRAISTTVPYTSKRDFDLHQYAEAEAATLQQLKGNHQIRRLDGAARSVCPRTREFLSTILQLIDDALAGRPTPRSVCYIFNARHYRATLLSVHPLAEKTVHITLRGNGDSMTQSYHHLKDARFEVLGEETETKSSFEMLLGTEGNLRGAPIQITYDPNWWFQVILNLSPGASKLGNPDTASR
jgi:hypothetical protein